LPFLSPIFADNMVLQRDKPDALWGWSEPGDKITAEIAGKATSATAGPDRRWQLQIQPPPAGGPYTLTIKVRQTIELHNVLVGDVWLCGGQSNMHVPLANALNGPEEVKAANYPQIRFFDVAAHPAYRHADIPEGSWKVVSPETADKVSAVAYYFARKVQEQIH